MIQSETLALLEWPRLCQHLATFASTKLGMVAAANLEPSVNQEESRKLIAQTQEVYELELRLLQGLSFEGIEDFGDSLERAELGGFLAGEELLAIATTLATMRRLRRLIDDQQEEIPNLKALVAQLRTYPEFEQEIHRCIDERGQVSDRASVKLGEIRGRLKALRGQIYQKLQNIMQRQGGALQQQVVTQRSDRFVLAVKAPQKDTIPGIVHDTSSTGATLYVEPRSVVNLGNQQRQLQRQEKNEEEAVLRRLTEQIGEIQEDLEYLLFVATTLDLTTAKARYSLWLEGNVPRFVNWQQGETITLRNLRHPLLVWQQKHEQGTEVVPINVQIEPQIRVVAITGPNTGGKTVTLKTLGLTALMAKAGIFIPATEPVELPWFEQVLADIGDEQSLEQSLSTFSGHIRRIIRVIEAIASQGETSNPQPSLVLLDEVGAGTDPAEGSALAIALLKYLAEQVQLTIATTHYGELKALKYEDERFENASVEFDDLSLSPTYRLLWGIPGRSNALTIAQRLGLPREVVEKAQSLMGEVNSDVNEVIAGLEAQRREQEEKAQQAKKLVQEAEKFYEQILAKARTLEAREKDLKLAQEQAIQKVLTEAKEEVAQVIRDLQQKPKIGQNAQKATVALNKIAETKLPKQEKAKPPKPGYQPQIGERVRIPSLGQTAEVLSSPDGDGELSVRFGLMKMNVSLGEIESLDGKKAEVAVKQKSSSTPAPATSKKNAPTVRTSQNTVDIRGERVADAERKLDDAIASIAVSGNVVWIIHGKGTGRLRQGVQEFLRQHPQVERFELAPQNEGGAGVTITYLK